MLGFDLVGYGCIICIGNFGFLFFEILDVIKKGDFVVMFVFFGNWNFEGWVNFDVWVNYLVFLFFVIVYVLVGMMMIDIDFEFLGESKDGKFVYLKDIWLNFKEIVDIVWKLIMFKMFWICYVDVFLGDKKW